MTDFLYNTVMIAAMQGIIASQDSDNRYMDHPGVGTELVSKWDIIANDAEKMTKALMKKMKVDEPG